MEVDSNSDKYLLYDKEDIYSEGYFNIYFKEMNSRELDDILNGLNIRVVKYIIDDKVYYAKSISELERMYLMDKNNDEKYYYSLNGINIDGISVYSSINELIKLDNLSFIY